MTAARRGFLAIIKALSFLLLPMRVISQLRESARQTTVESDRLQAHLRELESRLGSTNRGGVS